MTKAEILKKEILRQYRSVRQFAMEMNIPYSTLVTALERGIEGMAYGTVIKMCDKLSLNPVDFSSLERDASLGAQLLENRVMQNYVKLNQTGRDKILELMDKRRFDIGSMAPKELEGGLTYYGHLNLPGVDVYGYDEVYMDDATGETKPLIPDNMVLMIPSNANFMRAYGLCNYLDDGGNWHSFEGDRLLRTYVEHRPDRRFIELQSHPLLIPDKVDSWLVAEVC